MYLSLCRSKFCSLGIWNSVLWQKLSPHICSLGGLSSSLQYTGSMCRFSLWARQATCRVLFPVRGNEREYWHLHLIIILSLYLDKYISLIQGLAILYIQVKLTKVNEGCKTNIVGIFNPKLLKRSWLMDYESIIAFEVC